MVILFFVMMGGTGYGYIYIYIYLYVSKSRIRRIVCARLRVALCSKFKTTVRNIGQKQKSWPFRRLLDKQIRVDTGYGYICLVEENQAHKLRKVSSIGNMLKYLNLVIEI